MSLSTCIICGKEIRGPRCCTPEGDTHEGSCFYKNYWNRMIGYRDEGDRTEHGSIAVRSGGVHSLIMFENDDDSGRGCAGREFIFLFSNGAFSGKVIKTTNMWIQGDIPEDYQEQLTTNAQFITREQAQILHRSGGNRIYSLVNPHDGNRHHVEDMLVDVTDEILK